ncbi:hypothetical protein [Vibrio mediterranei]|uniref:hypothetical protein n=1 Tax=Vibrio mediterranei TaxID=689 RepID=UPI00148BDC27|nr:hypothetical protein [Vibrio mediterranei]NOI25403.1 hypothetical protein [Vibrio mediterranei]
MKKFETVSSDFVNYYYQHYYVDKALQSTENEFLKNTKREKTHGLYILAFLLYLLTLAMSIFKCFRISFERLRNAGENLVIINCNSSWSKVKKYIEHQGMTEYVVLYDDMRINRLNFQANGILESIDKPKRLTILIKTMFGNGSFFNLLNKVKEIFNEQEHDRAFILFLAKRFFFHELYVSSLAYLLIDNKTFKRVISGSTNERYAIAMEKICSDLGIETICIPHGISVSYKLPHGLFGQRYFCLSLKEKNILEGLYPNVKFIYEKNMISSILNVNSGRKKNGESQKRKIVVFTDSRAIYRDQNLINLVSSLTSEFYIKLHPNDSLSNYDLPSNGSILSEFKDAIYNSLCVTRVSTILLDALHNNSIPIAFLGADVDRNSSEVVYAGLYTDEVKKIYTEDKLKEVIRRYVDD